MNLELSIFLQEINDHKAFLPQIIALENLNFDLEKVFQNCV